MKKRGRSYHHDMPKNPFQWIPAGKTHELDLFVRPLFHLLIKWGWGRVLKYMTPKCIKFTFLILVVLIYGLINFSILLHLVCGAVDHLDFDCFKLFDCHFVEFVLSVEKTFGFFFKRKFYLC